MVGHGRWFAALEIGAGRLLGAAQPGLLQDPCFSNQYTTLPTITMLPEMTALAAAVAPAATSSDAHPLLLQLCMAASCTGCRSMRRE